MIEEVARAMDLGGQPEDNVPESVQVIVQSRMDALPADARALLALASVGGVIVDRQILRATSQLPASKFESLLEQLRTSLFLTSARGDRLAFGHALTQEVCYQSVLEDEQKRLHARWLDALKTELPEEGWPLEALAQHAHKAGHLSEALDLLKKACQGAVDVSAIQSALVLYDKAIAICREIGASADPRRLEFTLAVQQALLIRRDTRDVLALMTELRVVATRLDNPNVVNKVDGALANLKWYFGRYRSSAHTTRRTIDATRGVPKQFPTHCFSRFSLANTLYPIGNVVEAVDALEALIGDLKDERFGGMTTLSLWARAWLHWFQADLGQFDVSSDTLQAFFDMSDMRPEPYSQAALRATAGYAYLQAGRNKAEAVGLLQEAYGIIREKEIWTIEPNAAGWLAVTAARNGQPEIGEDAIERTSASSVSQYAAVHTDFLMKQGRAECHLARGRPDEALSAINTALTPMIKSRALTYISYGLETRGQVLLALDNHPDAKRDLERVKRLASHCGLKPLLARVDHVIEGLPDG